MVCKEEEATTPEEAINRLQARIDGELFIKGVDDCKDIQLGIEALRLTKRLRKEQGNEYLLLLPGETEE